MEKERLENTFYKFPRDLANHLLEVWDNFIAGDYTPPPVPSDTQLISLLETAYLASLEKDESRPVLFTLCVTPESYDFSHLVGSESIEIWPFTTDRQFSIQEIRKLAAATHIESSAIWVRFPMVEKGMLTIHGLVNFGLSWAHARRGYQYYHDQIPSALLLRVEGPGKLIAYQGSYRVATLIGGEIIKTQTVSIFDLLGAHQLFSEVQELLRDDIITPVYEIAREWHEFEWFTIANTILAIVNTIKLNGHGGALIIAGRNCNLNELLRIKYRLSEEADALRTRLVHFLNFRHKYSDMIWPPQFKEDAPKVQEETIQLTLNELLEAQRKLTDTCTFIGNLSGSDGAIILSTDLKTIGFGVEILLDKAKSSKVFVVKDPILKTREEGESESFGMRHRSAIRLCGSATDLAVFVVSQDGDVSLVWNDNGFSCYKFGIQTTNVNMVLA